MKKYCICFVVLLVLAFPGYSLSETKNLYINVPSENIRNSPNGEKFGELTKGAKLEVKEESGNWIKVSIDGWVWKPSTADAITSPKIGNSKSSPTLELVDFDVKQLGVDYEAMRMLPKVILNLHVKNNTNKKINAWRAILVVKNAFGDQLIKGQVTDGTADVYPGQVKEAAFGWEDNPFMENEPYDKISAYSKNNLNVSLVEIKLIQ